MSQEAPKARDASFDILKGIGIVGVIVLHASNWSATRLTTNGSNTWTALVLANRVTNIAVPLFLMVSALLLARSQSNSKAGWKRFYCRRLKGLLWPYLVWTLIFWFLRFAFSHPRSLEFWTDWNARGKDLLLGKASFHLYFMIVLLQFVVVFPLFYVALKRVRLGFFPALVAAVALQWLVMLAQKQVRFASPGSVFLWYLVPLVVGIWLGTNWKTWPELWRKWRLPFFLAFIAAMWWFLDVCIRQLANLPFTSNEHKWSHTTFTFFGSIVLLGISLNWIEAKTRFQRLFRHLGEYSLQLYLIHPILLTLMAGPRALSLLKRLPYSPVWVVLILIVVSYAIGRAIELVRLDGIVFGRSAAKPTKQPSG